MKLPIKLHRSRKQADWARLGRKRRNGWQRLAARTSGVVTLGNVFTLIGLLIVAAGLILIVQESYLLGLVLLVVGRLCDLLDGWLADLTATKSPLGALFDATADKVETAATVIVLVATGLLPIWLALAVLLPHAITAVLSLNAGLRGRPFQPSRAGKASMAIAWLGLAAVVLAAVVPGSGGLILGVAYGVCAMATVVGLGASRDYLHRR